MLLPESFQEKINVITVNALALSYIEEDELEIMNKIYLIDSNIEIRNKICYWGSNFSGEDLDNLDRKGITRENIENILNASYSLYQLSCLPLAENDLTSMYKEMGPLYYNLIMDKFKQYIDELEQLYNDCKSSLKDKEYLIKRDFRGLGNPKDLLYILNPYKLIKNAVPTLRKVIKKIEKHKEYSMENFEFSKKFQLLSTFMHDIQDKGLDENEIEELKTIWLFLMVKGSSLNQVRIKLNPTEIATFTNHEYYKNAISGNDPILWFQLTYLSDRSEKLYNNAGDINDESLNLIYQKHQNGEIKQILQPVIDELIPYYKSLITPEGFLKLTLEISDIFAPIKHSLQTLIMGDDYLTEPRICPAYFKKIQFKIVNPPGDSYQRLLDNLIYAFRTNYYSYCFKNAIIPDLQLPDLEDVKNIDTLEKQKYFAAWILCKRAKDQKLIMGSIVDACFVLSLLNWKIDCDSDEARIIEDRMKKEIKMWVKGFKRTSFTELKKLINWKYIYKKLLPAIEPLNQNDFKKKITNMPADCNIC